MTRLTGELGAQARLALPLCEGPAGQQDQHDASGLQGFTLGSGPSLFIQLARYF